MPSWCLLTLDPPNSKTGPFCTTWLLCTHLQWKLFSFQIDKTFKKQVFLQLICLLVLWIRIILWKLRWKKISNIPISKLHLEKNHILSVKKCISDDLHLFCSLTNCYWHGISIAITSFQVNLEEKTWYGQQILLTFC